MTKPDITSTLAAAPAPERLLDTIPEAAYRLGVGRSTLYELVDAGELEIVKIGRSSRIPVASSKAYVERLRSRAKSPEAA